MLPLIPQASSIRAEASGQRASSNAASCKAASTSSKLARRLMPAAPEARQRRAGGNRPRSRASPALPVPARSSRTPLAPHRHPCFRPRTFPFHVQRATCRTEGKIPPDRESEAVDAMKILVADSMLRGRAALQTINPDGQRAKSPQAGRPASGRPRDRFASAGRRFTGIPAFRSGPLQGGASAAWPTAAGGCLTHRHVSPPGTGVSAVGPSRGQPACPCPFRQDCRDMPRRELAHDCCDGRRRRAAGLSRALHGQLPAHSGPGSARGRFDSPDPGRIPRIRGVRGPRRAGTPPRRLRPPRRAPPFRPCALHPAQHDESAAQRAETRATRATPGGTCRAARTGTSVTTAGPWPPQPGRPLHCPLPCRGIPEPLRRGPLEEEAERPPAGQPADCAASVFSVVPSCAFSSALSAETG